MALTSEVLRLTTKLVRARRSPRFIVRPHVKSALSQVSFGFPLAALFLLNIASAYRRFAAASGAPRRAARGAREILLLDPRENPLIRDHHKIAAIRVLDLALGGERSIKRDAAADTGLA